MKPKKHSSKISTVIPIRVSNEQLVALRTLPEEISISALARALFKAYLEGSLPIGVYERVEVEARRTREAVRSGQQKLKARGKELRDGKQQRQERAAERAQSLRESLFLKLREYREGDAA